LEREEWYLFIGTFQDFFRSIESRNVFTKSQYLLECSLKLFFCNLKFTLNIFQKRNMSYNEIMLSPSVHPSSLSLVLFFVVVVASTLAVLHLVF